MKNAHEFRRNLFLRLFALIAAAGPFAAMGSTTLSSCTCPTDPVEGQNCFTWPPADNPDAGMTGNGGAAGMGGGGGAGGGMSSGMPACPSKADAKAFFTDPYGGQILEVLSDATPGEGSCCYNTRYIPECIGGRPFVVDEHFVVAPIVYGTQANGFLGPTIAASNTQLTDDDRAELAASWAREGQFEHASIASFGRFALSLMALGAPADLIADAHRAALDEINHARLCFALASAYAGESIGPGFFPFSGNLDMDENLASFAVRTLHEGCLGETIAACVAAEKLRMATDPAVRQALEVITSDESRHAELAFRTVAWALRAGGEPVRAAIIQACASSVRPMGRTDQYEKNDLAAHGRLSPRAEKIAQSRAIEDVIRPALRALLATIAPALPHVDAAPTYS